MRGIPLFVLSLFLHIPENSLASAIHDAASNGDIAAISAALDAGANIDETGPSGTALYLAVRRGHAEAAMFLIERGADVNAASGRGPALLAATKKNNIDLITLLLEHGADPNSSLAKETALHVAAQNGCLDCVEALVRAGADVNAQTNDGKTPIHLAKVRGNSDISSYLLENGVVLPVPEPISTLLADADLENGKATFEKECSLCHSAESQATRKSGPNLWNIVGREKASVSNFSYSPTLRAWEGSWTYDDLNTFISGPMLTTPGVYMEIMGISNAAERANVIAYLRTISDDPVPLP